MIEMMGCTWAVVRRYQLTDEEMNTYGLWYRDRITLECVEAPAGHMIQIGEVRDIANTANL